MDIHNYAEELNYAFESLASHKELSGKNKEIIRNLAQQFLANSYSKPRTVKYIDTARHVALRFKKDYDKWTENDVREYLAWLEQKSVSPWTKQWYKVFIKRMMQFVHGMSEKEYPAIVAKIKVNIPRNQIKLPNEGEILTYEETQQILSKCKNSRDRAFVSSFTESGCRISELGNMLIKNVKFDQYGAVLSVSGKTGARQVRVINAVPFLAAWLSDHPLKNNREAPLWVKVEGNHTQVKYQRWRQLLKELGEAAGIQKRVNPHSFRHARATYLANHLTEFQMNQYLGWKQGSDMASTYIHLSGKNTDNALLKMYGLNVKDEKANDMKPLKCTRCDSINPYGAQYCVKCGMVLNEVAAAEIDENVKQAQQEQIFGAKAMSQLLKDPEVLELLKRKLVQVTS